MEKAFSTKQEDFWAGEFGDCYVGRSHDTDRVARRTALFAKIISKTKGVKRILELGANVGHNILALRNLVPEGAFTAVEINNRALMSLKEIPEIHVIGDSVLNCTPAVLGLHDLAFTAGVLIHINPDLLPCVYDLLYNCSSSYVLVDEYYSPAPVELGYRGNSEMLFKRDFAGELMDRYPDLELVDYGFQYHRDNNFSADDSTWFLLKKK